MDLSYPESAERFRDRVRRFLDDELPADWQGLGALDHDEVDRFTSAWRLRLYEAGLLGVSWPAEFGGGALTHLEEIVLHEELAVRAAPLGVPNDIFGLNMIGPTLLRWGTDEQRRHFIPRILSGDDLWCQGYSEPNAGSDLAGLGCRARLDGDEWVIDGQKVWTSYGHTADWIFLLVRNGTGDRKHDGITFLLVPMDQEGITIRPIRMISGEPEFNEVFFDGARTARTNVVGEVGAGWRVAMSLLGYERGQEAATAHIRFRQELDRLREFARSTGATDDPRARQRLAHCYAKVEMMRFLGLRALTRFLADAEPGPDAAIFKLYWSEYHQEVTEFAVELLGASAMTPSGRWPTTVAGADDLGVDPASTSSWVGTFLNARAGTIYSGTSQIQRNVIGESVLGLPREPRPPAAAPTATPRSETS